jgi:hypothetical protein
MNSIFESLLTDWTQILVHILLSKYSFFVFCFIDTSFETMQKNGFSEILKSVSNINFSCFNFVTLDGRRILNFKEEFINTRQRVIVSYLAIKGCHHGKCKMMIVKIQLICIMR